MAQSGKIVAVRKGGSRWRCPDQCGVTASFRSCSHIHGSRRYQAQFHHRPAARNPFHSLKRTLGLLSPGFKLTETELSETSTSKPAEFKWHSYRTRNTILRRPQACLAAAPQQQHPQLLTTTASPNLLPSLPRQRPHAPQKMPAQAAPLRAARALRTTRATSLSRQASMRA